MTDRFVEPFARFFTTDLKTLPGAKLYFYENGTTTPKTIYRDPFKNNTHSNPVIAGTFGAPADAFPAIYMDGTYTVELKSSAGVTQPGWPQDNIGGEQVEGNFDTWSAINSYSIGDLVTGSDGNRYESTANNNLNYDPTVLANRTGKWKRIFLTGEYVATETYDQDDLISYNGILYISVAGSNLGNTPSTSPNKWQKITGLPVWGNATTYLQYARVTVSGITYISQQNANLNHDPVTDDGTWWKPEWMTVDGLTQVKYLSGGGNLYPYWDNWLTDSNSYALPAANTVPANAQLVVTKPDKYRTSTPTVTLTGGDYLEWSGANNTDGIQLLTSHIEVLKFISNGSNGWRIG